MTRLPLTTSDDDAADEMIRLDSATPLRALGNHPELARKFVGLARYLYRQGTLPTRTAELVILRIAAMLKCDYAWSRHVPTAMKAGVTIDEVRAVRAGDIARLSDEEQGAIRYAEAVERNMVDDAVWNLAAQHYPAPAQMVELTVLAAFYGMLTRVFIAIDADLDEGYDGLEVP
jgi:4-carboxymuconolactone decarboxylase